MSRTLSDTADLAASISLPGRPIAEALARRLVTAGADLSRCIVGTFGDDQLHLFRYGEGTNLLIFEDRTGAFIVMNSDYDMHARTNSYTRFTPRAAGLALDDVVEIINRHFPDDRSHTWSRSLLAA